VDTMTQSQKPPTARLNKKSDSQRN